MLTRLLFAAFIVVTLASCQRLSADERKVVGTWKQKSFDGTEYYIVRPDHSYAYVGDISDPGEPVRIVLCSSGTWHIQGDDLILDGVAAQSTDQAKLHPPEKSVHRWKVAEFVKFLEPHPAVSYEKL